MTTPFQHQLPEYVHDNLWCHNMPVDSRDYDGGKDPFGARERKASMGMMATTTGGQYLDALLPHQ